MGRVTHGPPLDLVADLIKGLDLRVAVETGTFEGATAAAFRELVPEVWTVELFPQQIAVAQARNRGIEGIHYLSGASPARLDELSAAIKGPVFFWCDAHALAHAEPSDSAMPICDELRAIGNFSGAAESCILIDDARLFMGPHVLYPGHELPLLTDILALLVTENRYVTILHDVIIAVPAGAKPIVDRWWYETCGSRDEVDIYCDRWLAALDAPPSIAAKRLGMSCGRYVVRWLRRLRGRVKSQ